MQCRLGLQVYKVANFRRDRKEVVQIPHGLQDFCHTSVGNMKCPLMCFEEECYNVGKDLSLNTLSVTESQINKTELYRRTEPFAHLLKKKPYFHNKFTSGD